MSGLHTEAEARAKTARIRELNDRLRTWYIGGQTVRTQGVMRLPPDTVIEIAKQIESFSDFTEENDPYGEHDFGAVTVDGHKVFWKIDYYASDMAHGSEDPADPKQTRRVLTIMLAEEY